MKIILNNELMFFVRRLAPQYKISGYATDVIIIMCLKRRLQPWLLPACHSRCARLPCRHPGSGHRSQDRCSSVQASRQQTASYRQTIARSELRRQLQIRVGSYLGGFRFV